jgi:alpha-tubulin suppressor-like RCC1 family protein
MRLKCFSFISFFLFILYIAFFSSCSMSMIQSEKNAPSQMSIDSLLKTVGAGSMVRQVAAGIDFSMAVVKDGPGNQTLWVIGFNNMGQLGLGDTKNRSTWQNVGLNNVRYVACNQYHALCIAEKDSALYVAGDNSYGQLGLGYSNGKVIKWTKTSLTNVSQVACGFYHNIIAKDGKLYAAGDNFYGQLGLNTSIYSSVNTWTVSPTLTKFNDKIACGFQHSMAVDTDGSLWATGNNYYGQLGLGRNGGYVSNWTNVNFGSITYAYTVKGIACGNFHSICYANGYLKSTSNYSDWLWVTGDNSYGQIGLPAGIAKINSWQQIGYGNIVKVACGENHSMFLTSTGNPTGYGSLWVTGNNGYGQLGLGDLNNRHGWEPTVYGNIRAEAYQTALAGGWNHSIFVSHLNQVWSAGSNSYSQLGIPSSTAYWPWFIEN